MNDLTFTAHRASERAERARQLDHLARRSATERIQRADELCRRVQTTHRNSSQSSAQVLAAASMQLAASRCRLFEKYGRFELGYLEGYSR
jgi:hypothetical protein